MADKNEVSIKVYPVDHLAAKAETQEMPITIKDLVCAWRLNWEATSPTKRMQQLKRVASIRNKSTTAA